MINCQNKHSYTDDDAGRAELSAAQNIRAKQKLDEAEAKRKASEAMAKRAESGHD